MDDKKRIRIDRRLFIRRAGIGCAGLLLGCRQNTIHQIHKRPNIIYINVDDMGWTDTGFMGSRYYETPNIDHLASQGMVFTNAYAPAANCAPSRACCFSGQYAPRHGIYTVDSSERGKARDRKLIPTPNKTVLDDDTLTLAEALKAGGYTTCHVGKWHLGQDPCTQGFDVNIGGSLYGHPKSYFSPYQNDYLEDGPAGEYLTDRLISETLHFIESNQKNSFFINLAFYTVHTPLQAKTPIADHFKQKPGDDRHHNATYAAMIKSLDDNIGRVMNRLDELNLSNKTLILFTSDNGGVYNISKQWPLRAGKGSYYEGGIREPLIVRWPGQVKPGSTSEASVCGIDYYPTFLEAAGLAKPEGKIFDGVSLIPILTGKGNILDRPLFWHFPIYLEGGNTETQDPLFRCRPGSAVRMGPWKLIEYFENNDLELYNLHDDPGEKINLATSHPQECQELFALLQDWRKKVHAPVPTELNPEYCL